MPAIIAEQRSLRAGHMTASALLRAHVPERAIVVDAGAFPGTLTEAMHADGFRVIALDTDPDRQLGIQARFHDGRPIAVAEEQTFAERMRALGVETRACDLEVAPYPIDTHAADAIVFTEVIEHLYVNPLVAMSEANRVLKPKGVCLMSTPNLLSLWRRWNLLMGRMHDVIEHPVLAFFQKHQIGHVGHVRIYAPQELIDLLNVFGFSVAVSFYDFDYWDPPLSSPGSGPTPAETPEPARSGRRVQRWFSSPRNLLQALGATTRVWLERRYPHLRAHMFLVARKERDVRLDDLELPALQRQLRRSS